MLGQPRLTFRTGYCWAQKRKLFSFPFFFSSRAIFSPLSHSPLSVLSLSWSLSPSLVSVSVMSIGSGVGVGRVWTQCREGVRTIPHEVVASGLC
jgi:hypothetical protein